MIAGWGQVNKFVEVLFHLGLVDLHRFVLGADRRAAEREQYRLVKDVSPLFKEYAFHGSSGIRQII